MWQQLGWAEHHARGVPLQDAAADEGGSGRGATNGTGTYGTVSQFELLEESGPGTQPLGPADSLNRSTLAHIG